MCRVEIINFNQGAFLIGVEKGEDQVYDKEVVIAPANGRFCDFDEIELMESIGVYDDHGVEIWEGDIVRWCINNQIRTAPVEYVDEQASFWMMKDSETGMSVINDWMRGEYEVIGNIHQHPNLLE